MSEINSIANGTFTIGQTSATNFVAGPGIKIDSPSEGTVRIGTDETVLYEGSANYNLINFSEPASNFERIRLQISIVRPSIFEFPSEIFTNNNWPGGDFGNGWGGKPAHTVFELSANDNGFKVNAGWHTESTGAVAWTNLNVSSTWIRPMKVWGVNRISGSNA